MQQNFVTDIIKLIQGPAQVAFCLTNMSNQLWMTVMANNMAARNLILCLVYLTDTLALVKLSSQPESICTYCWSLDFFYIFLLVQTVISCQLVWRI